MPKKVVKNEDFFEDSLEENSDEDDAEGKSIRKRFRTCEDIWDFLDDEDKPFIKRLKLAEVFYRKENFDVKNREVVLLTWMCSNQQTDLRNLKTCLAWLQSERFKNLEISSTQSKDLLHAIIERLKYCCDYETERTIVKMVLLMMESPLLNQQSSAMYCSFIGELINSIKNDDLLLDLLQSPHLNDNFMRPNFLQNFISSIMAPLTRNGARFLRNPKVYHEITKFITWGLFGFKFQYFNEYVNSKFKGTSIRNDYASVKTIFQHLQNMYGTGAGAVSYKIIFDTFCASAHADSMSRFKFFVLLMAHLGFKMREPFKLVDEVVIEKSSCHIGKSIEIASELFRSLAEHEISSYSLVNGVNINTFCCEYLKFVLDNFCEADERLLVQIQSAIKLSPTCFEPIAGRLLQFIFRANVDKCGSRYAEVFKDILVVYSKLHRLRQLINTLTVCLKSDGSEEMVSQYSFCKKLKKQEYEVRESRIEYVLSEEILECFKDGVTKLNYSLAVDLYGIFRNGLKEILENFNVLAKDKSRVIYVEIMCTLMSHFFRAVSIVERKVPKATQLEFYGFMNADKLEILGKFGEALLKLKHYQKLISVYLNLCYSWGELYILMNHYSMLEEIKFSPTPSNDHSVFNIVYLHPYLVTEKWNLFYERIENFGSLPCQLVMIKLCIQKLRAMMIFEEEVHEEVESNLMNYIVHSLESNANFRSILRKFVIEDNLCMLYLLPKMKGKVLKRMAGVLFWEPSEALKRCESLVEAIYFLCLEEIGNLHKDVSKSSTSQYFGRFKRADFMHAVDKSEEICGALNAMKANKKCYGLDVDSLRRIIDVFKFYDVYSLKENMLQIIVWFMYSLLSDLQVAEVEASKVSVLREVRDDVERIFLGLYSSPARMPAQVRNKKLLMDLLNLNLKTTFKYLQQNPAALREVALCEGSSINACTGILAIQLMSDNAENQAIFDEIGEKFIDGIEEFSGEDYAELYCIFYKYYLRDKKKMKIIRRKVDFYRDVMLKGKWSNTKGLVQLMKLFMSHHVEKLNDEFVHELWKRVWGNADFEANLQVYSELLGNLLICVKSDEKFEVLIGDVRSAMNKSASNLKGGDRFNKLATVLDATMKQNLSNYKLKSVYGLVVNVALHLIAEDGNDVGAMLDALFEPMRRLIAIDEKRHTPTARTMEAVCMMVSRRLEAASSRSFGACADLLKTLLLSHKLLCHDRMPSILNQCRALFGVLCLMNNQLDSVYKDKQAEVLACAYAFEKLIASIKMSKETVDNNIAVFMIVDMLRRYEDVTFNPIVKISIDNCIFHLLTRCDARSKHYLESVLSPASTEIFNDLNSTFRKHYLYMGAS